MILQSEAVDYGSYQDFLEEKKVPVAIELSQVVEGEELKK